MALPPGIHGHFLKLNWAGQNLQNLDRAISGWFEGNQHFSYRVEPDGNNPPHTLVKVSADDIPVYPLSFIVGDIIQNIRSSLDHAAYSLAASYTNPLPKENALASQFPIIGDESKKGVSGQGPAGFARALQSDICCIDPRAQALVEAVQPYKDGAGFRDHPLWMLRELSNIDKHRFIHLSAASIEKVTVRKCSIEGQFALSSGIVKNDTVIASFESIRALDPDQTVEMNVVPRLTIGFADAPFAGRGVIGTLKNIYDFVGDHVLTPLTKYL